MQSEKLINLSESVWKGEGIFYLSSHACYVELQNLYNKIIYNEPVYEDDISFLKTFAIDLYNALYLILDKKESYIYKLGPHIIRSRCYEIDMLKKIEDDIIFDKSVFNSIEEIFQKESHVKVGASLFSIGDLSLSHFHKKDTTSFILYIIFMISFMNFISLYIRDNHTIYVTSFKYNSYLITKFTIKTLLDVDIPLFENKLLNLYMGNLLSFNTSQKLNRGFSIEGNDTSIWFSWLYFE